MMDSMADFWIMFIDWCRTSWHGNICAMGLLYIFIFLKVSSLITYDYDDFLRYLLAHHISLVFSSNKKVRVSGILLVGIIWSDRSQIQGTRGKLQFSPGQFWGDFGTWSSLDQWLKSQWLSPSWEVLQMFLLGLCMLWKITFESFYFRVTLLQ